VINVKKMGNKGFTLIEIVAVVVILGVIMTIAVPAVSEQILSSRKSSYLSSVSAYAETIMGEYDMKSFGSYLYDDEIMLVPIKNISLDKGANMKSPFGNFLNNYSYIVVAPENNSYTFYANFLDDAGYGINMVPVNSLEKNDIKKTNKSDIRDISYFVSCSVNAKKYTLSDIIFEYNNKVYVPCDYRVYDTDASSEIECDSTSDLAIVVMCEQ